MPSGNRIDRDDSQTGSERLDVGGKLGKVERTPAGGIRLDARLTRPGIFRYVRADGTVSRELRPPEEVFRADSLATLEDAPVTALHPSETGKPRIFVTPATWREDAIGHARSARQDAGFVAAKVAIDDASAIRRVDGGELAEISCGYRCDEDRTPGTYEGQPYDLVQRNIRYNHVAIGPKGWGRAGRDVALRLDANGAVLETENEEHPAPRARQDNGAFPMNIKIDGVSYPLNTPAEIQAAINASERHTAKLDAERAALVSERDKASGRADAAEKNAAEAKKALEEATDPAKLDAAVAAHVELVAKARKIAPKAKLDGLGRRALMEAALGEKHDGKSDDYVAGLFEGRAAAAPKIDAAARAATTRLPVAEEKNEGERADAGDEPDADKARAKAEAFSREAWRTQNKAS